MSFQPVLKDVIGVRRFWCVLLAAVCGLSLALAPDVARADENSTDDLIRFSDVSEGVQFHDEIMWLANKGVSTGWLMDDGSREFRPVQPVARDAMAAFLYRLAGSPAYEAPDVSPFTDVSIDSQFYTEIAWLAKSGISSGWVMGDGSRQFRPLDSVARDAMAAFLYRYADVVMDEDVAGFQTPGVSPFSDVPSSSQFFRQIAWLAGRGVSTGWDVGGGVAEFRDLESVARDAMAAFMYRLHDQGGTDLEPPAGEVLSITTAGLVEGVVGQVYSATLTAVGGTPPYSWATTELPADLVLDGSSGAISGVPAIEGTRVVTVTLGDDAGDTVNASERLEVFVGEC